MGNTSTQEMRNPNLKRWQYAALYASGPSRQPFGKGFLCPLTTVATACTVEPDENPGRRRRKDQAHHPGRRPGRAGARGRRRRRRRKRRSSSCAAGRFDVVVTDLKMPKLDGIELLKRIKQGPLADMEVIMMTAYGSIPVAVEAMQAGGVRFPHQAVPQRGHLPAAWRGSSGSAQAAGASRAADRFSPADVERPIIGRSAGDGPRQADDRNLRPDRRQRAAVRRDGRGQGPARRASSIATRTAAASPTSRSAARSSRRN